MNNTNQASLYELCQEVYELTRWKDTHSRLDDGNHTIRNEGNEVLLGSKQAPLYTSDYLLEKLPYKIGKGNSAIWLRLGKTRNGFTVCYMGSDLVCLHECEADTPLLALLKLTIALSEAGELNE